MATTRFVVAAATGETELLAARQSGGETGGAEPRHEGLLADPSAAALVLARRRAGAAESEAARSENACGGAAVAAAAHGADAPTLRFERDPFFEASGYFRDLVAWTTAARAEAPVTFEVPFAPDAAIVYGAFSRCCAAPRAGGEADRVRASASARELVEAARLAAFVQDERAREEIEACIPSRVDAANAAWVASNASGTARHAALACVAANFATAHELGELGELDHDGVLAVYSSPHLVAAGDRLARAAVEWAASRPCEAAERSGRARLLACLLHARRLSAADIVRPEALRALRARAPPWLGPAIDGLCERVEGSSSCEAPRQGMHVWVVTGASVIRLLPDGSMARCARLRVRRAHFAASELHGELLISGGIDARTGLPTRSCEAFSARARTVSDMPDLPAPRAHHKSAATPDGLFVASPWHGAPCEWLARGAARWRSEAALPLTEVVHLSLAHVQGGRVAAVSWRCTPGACVLACFDLRTREWSAPRAFAPHGEIVADARRGLRALPAVRDLIDRLERNSVAGECAVWSPAVEVRHGHALLCANGSIYAIRDGVSYRVSVARTGLLAEATPCVLVSEF